MRELKIIDVNAGVFDAGRRLAEETRTENRARGLYLVNLMASPGAGKTSVLLRTAKTLRNRFSIGVMEADIDASVDAEKILSAGIRSIQVHTGGECAMNAFMTRQALNAFDTQGLDLIFLENVGNLVCPAEEDVGSSLNVEILSIPEGDDKPLKYPLMFQVCQCILINKTDTRAYFPFDDAAVTERIHRLNPDAKIFFLSARTGEGFDAWTDYLTSEILRWKNS